MTPFTKEQRDTARRMFSEPSMLRMNISARAAYVHDVLAGKFGGVFNNGELRQLVHAELVKIARDQEDLLNKVEVEKRTRLKRKVLLYGGLAAIIILTSVKINVVVKA